MKFRALLLVLSIINISDSAGFHAPNQVSATKGKFFVHTLHSANFFPTHAKVKWEATLSNKPALPNWLRLMESRHPEIAYLIGTPVTNVQQVTIHVIAKRLDNFDIQQRVLVINLVEDYKFTGNTQQVLDIPLNGIDVEDFISNRDRKITALESSLRGAFRGKNVNPYIADVRNRYLIPHGKEHIFKNSVGTVVSIGTQNKFYPGTVSMVRNLQTTPDFCSRPSAVAMNKFFAPTFSIDWCNVNLRNVTSMDDDVTEAPSSVVNVGKAEKKGKKAKEDKPDLPPPANYAKDGFGFLTTIVIAPAIGVILVAFLFALTCIFFGTREGQHWRDYKTSAETMEEFVNVKESQKHLRELSVQRQLLSMTNDSQSSAPTGIHSFLQPRSRAPSSIARFSKSASRLNDREETLEIHPSVDHIPVGKQTVAEAAKQCGSSLHLYRNPLDTESDEEDTESEKDEQ